MPIMDDHSQHNTMNFDLNLEPVVQPPQIEDWIIGTSREVVSNHITTGQRFSSLSRHIPATTVAGNMALRLVAGDSYDNDHERSSKRIKTSEDCGDQKDVKKIDKLSFFDCNICLDLATDPVVTCCGHLFCWACLYRWLFIHSKADECPNCKGEVMMKTITPIYSRRNRTIKVDKNSTVKIPSRPKANRIDNWREAFQRVNAPMFDVIRRLDNRFDITRDSIPENPQETPTIPLNRIFTPRWIRRVRESDNRVTEYVTSVDPISDLGVMPSVTSAQSYVESYIRDHPDEQNEEEFALIDRETFDV